MDAVDDNDEATTGTSQQATAREEFAIEGIRDTNDKAAAAKDDSLDYQAKQAV